MIFLQKKQKKNKFYEVVKIVGEKKEKHQIFFLVKWRGYPLKHNSWVAEIDCDCQPHIEKYRKKGEQVVLNCIEN